MFIKYVEIFKINFKQSYYNESFISMNFRIAENEGKHGLHYFVLLIFISNTSIANSKKLLGAITNLTKAPISIIILGRKLPESDEIHNITSSKKNIFPGVVSSNSDFVEVSFCKNFVCKIIFFFLLII